MGRRRKSANRSQSKSFAGETTDFPLAIADVIAGKKITRLAWGNKEFYAVLESGRLKIHKADGLFYDWVIVDADLTADDWVTI